MDVFGPPLTLNFNTHGSLRKELSHEQSEIAEVLAATQVPRVYSCELLYKHCWHVHLALQIQKFYEVHLNINSSNCLPSPRKDILASTVQSWVGTGLLLFIH